MQADLVKQQIDIIQDALSKYQSELDQINYTGLMNEEVQTRIQWLIDHITELTGRGIHFMNENKRLIGTFDEGFGDGLKEAITDLGTLYEQGEQLAKDSKTADYLLAGIGSVRQAFSNVDEIGQQYSRCDTGKFRLRGYYGDTATDHLKHLYAMHLMVSQALALLGGPTDVTRDRGEIPRDEMLLESFPNPFNASTEITFHVPVHSDVRLEGFDGLGRKLQTIVRGEFAPGDYRAHYDAMNTPSGTYYLTLSLGERRQSRRIVLTK